MHPYGNHVILYNISANLFRGIQQLYGKAISEVQVNGITKRMVNNITMPSLVFSLLHFFLERAISDGKASIGGRTITSLRSSDNIDALDC